MIHRLAAVAMFAVMPCAVQATGPVVLTTLDGSHRIEGELVSADGDYFRIETKDGGLTIDFGDVTCAGAGCPDPDALVAHAVVGGPADMIHRLMPPLLETFAEAKGLGYRHIFTSDETVTWELIDSASGNLQARIEGRVEEVGEAVARVSTRDMHLSLGRLDGGAKVDQDVIALDALVPVVSIDNPRAMITLTQFRALLTGRIGNWAELDGPDLTVGEEAAVAVEGDPAALGLVPLSKIGNTVPLVIGGSCGLSTPATRANVKSEDYPLTQPLFLHRNGARQPRIIREFIAYARSIEAQPVIQAAVPCGEGQLTNRVACRFVQRRGGRTRHVVIRPP